MFVESIHFFTLLKTDEEGNGFSKLPCIVLQYGTHLFLQTATSLGQLKCHFSAQFFAHLH